MAFSPTAYLYVYCRTEQEGIDRISFLFEKLRKYGGDNVVKLEDDVDSLITINDSCQVLIESDEFRESWNVCGFGFNNCNVVDFQLINIKTNSSLCSDTHKKFISSLLNERLIDVAKIFLPKSVENKLFNFKKYIEVYYGYEYVIVFHLAQLKYFHTRAKIEKHTDQLQVVLSKYWEQLMSDNKIIEVDVKDSYKFLKNNKSDLLLEITNILDIK